ncbi:acyl-CoA thioesterase [Leptospira kemamanensis]|uniref:Acyl-CoA thioesterase n=1 Tax=Leptospira kemamanensis TaxID=2484942 RepID=A0A4R9JN15_9LEPT|nr:hotdog domain-containing protein [Leptospira kemamanensis]TGL47268.1 acyl-CoA thioesterase [Leptospira kemamanensis]
MVETIQNKLRDMELVTQHLVQPDDLNYHNNLFGGKMLSWIDEGMAMYVMNKIRYTNIVTMSMDNVVFRSPARAGDIIQIYGKIVKYGKSSITSRTLAITNHPQTGKMSAVIESDITYVCLGENGKPTAYFRNFTPPI